MKSTIGKKILSSSLLILGVFLGEVSGAFAQPPPSGGNILGGSYKGVNITPRGDLSQTYTNGSGNTMATLNYDITFGKTESSDESQTLGGLTVSIPEEATNIKFTFIGTWQSSASTFMEQNPDLNTTTDAWGIPKEVHFPLDVCSESGCEFGGLPSYDVLQKLIADGHTSIGVVTDSKLQNILGTQKDPGYHDYSLPDCGLKYGDVTSSWCMNNQIRVTFDVPSNGQNYPIRARTQTRHFLEVSEDFDAHRGTYTPLPLPKNIQTSDFNENGLYLNAESCAVTRNLGTWYMVSGDISTQGFNAPSKFNFILNPATTYLATYSEDLCDQAAISTQNIVSVTPTILTRDVDLGEIDNQTGTSALVNEKIYPVVLVNDTIVTSTGVVTFDISNYNGLEPLISLDANKENFSIRPSTETGKKEITYKVCLVDHPDICSESNIFFTLVEKLPAISATPDISTITNTQTGTIDILKNDSFSGVTPTPNDVTLTLTGNITDIPGIHIDDSGKIIVPPVSKEGTVTIGYVICDKVHPDNCATTAVEIALKPEVLSVTTPIPANPPSPPVTTPPPAPSTEQPRSSGGSSGGGNSSATPPPTIVKPSITPTITPPLSSAPEREILFVSPKIGDVCQSAVTNLNDSKLIAYYDDLKIIHRENVDRALTRAEFLKMVLHAGEVNLAVENTGSMAGFADLDASMWYYPYFAYAFNHKVMHGQEMLGNNEISQKIMRPNDTISRAEASKILTELMRAIDVPLPKHEEIHTFADINPDDMLAPYVQFAYNSCLLHGRNTINGEPIDGKPRIFEPADGITLAETAKVLYNITHNQNGERILPETSTTATGAQQILSSTSTQSGNSLNVPMQTSSLSRIQTNATTFSGLILQALFK